MYWVAPSKTFFLYCVSFEIREKTAGEDRKKAEKNLLPFFMVFFMYNLASMPILNQKFLESVDSYLVPTILGIW